jgi:CDGSH-type Zn-finger protein
MAENNANSTPQKKIRVKKDGEYIVEGGIPLVRKVQVVSEYGEPLTWKKEEDIPVGQKYILCSCGHSGKKPFCDGAHRKAGFDGTETADTGTFAERQETLPGTGIVVRYDDTLCMESGFCADRFAGIRDLVGKTDDTRIRSLVIAMVERCPAGAYTYAEKEGEPDIEPDLPQQIAVTVEITDEGPIMGALWVTGYIPIERADGKPFETRNRVTLCRCGLSKNKPLCDGEHRYQHVKEE